jgi:tetratricopeptide (TPR) repeat protein
VSLKHYRLAAETAEAAMARNPRNARLRFLAGTLHAAIGDVARARELMETAAQDLTADPNVSFAVGVFFRDDALDRGKADEYFRAYLRLAPNGAHRDEATASLLERIER